MFRASPHAEWGVRVRRGILLNKEFFVISFDTLRLVPEWVSYHLTAEMLDGRASRTDDFRSDPELPTSRRSELGDYERSGYDRGHMAPAADFKRSRRAMSSTFLLSNMAPQTARLNQRIWNRLESDVRSRARAHGSVWIVTGRSSSTTTVALSEPRHSIKGSLTSSSGVPSRRP